MRASGFVLSAFVSRVWFGSGLMHLNIVSPGVANVWLYLKWCFKAAARCTCHYLLIEGNCFVLADFPKLIR